MTDKKYFWLKLKEDYFSNPKIKKLRKIAGGDTYTIIYLKMQLESIRNGGIIKFEGIEQTFEEELALKLDENVDDVSMTLAYLKAQNLIEESEQSYLFIEASDNIGKECESAERVRLFRERKKEKSLQCNGVVTDLLQTSISNISNSNSNIFDYWNSKDIIIHKELNEDRKKAIEKALKIYTEEQIKTYIDRYKQVIDDAKYFFNYKWTLQDFLNRKDGISSFTDEGSKWLSYKQTKKNDGVAKFGHEQREYKAEELNSLFDNLDDVEI